MIRQPDAVAGPATPDTEAAERAHAGLVATVIAVLAYNREARAVLRQIICDEIDRDRRERLILSGVSRADVARWDAADAPKLAHVRAGGEFPVHAHTPEAASVAGVS